MDFWHWLQHLTGADDGSGAWYSFWSGFGADIGEIALLGAAVGVYRKHNCHVHRCWRIAKQDIEGTTWKVCHKHHPCGKPTAQDIADHHEKLLATKAQQHAVLRDAAHQAVLREREAVTGHAGEEALVVVETEDIHPPST